MRRHGAQRQISRARRGALIADFATTSASEFLQNELTAAKILSNRSWFYKTPLPATAVK
jgi:hypothetical protein